MSNDVTVAFIGAGRVAAVLGPAMGSAGWDVRYIASRSSHSAESVASSIPGAVAVPMQEAASGAVLVFLTTNDNSFEGVARSLAWRGGQCVVHCSGATSLSPLQAPSDAGGVGGSWHPYQTFGSERLETSLHGVTFGIEAADPLYGLLSRITESLGGFSLRVPAESRVLYHASSVFACGYLATLIHEATVLWRQAGLDPDLAMEAIGHIAEVTLKNIRARGTSASLTGPTSRGDIGTVRMHIEHIESRAPELLGLYRSLTERSLELAKSGGRPGTELDWSFLAAPNSPAASEKPTEKDQGS